MPTLPHSDESVERAFITLRGITQELRGRGISAVMLLEEQLQALQCLAVNVSNHPAPAVAEPAKCPHDGHCHPGFCPCKGAKSAVAAEAGEEVPLKTW
jgi:hypothetical protein